MKAPGDEPPTAIDLIRAKRDKNAVTDSGDSRDIHSAGDGPVRVKGSTSKWSRKASSQEHPTRHLGGGARGQAERGANGDAGGGPKLRQDVPRRPKERPSHHQLHQPLIIFRAKDPDPIRAADDVQKTSRRIVMNHNTTRA
jgi:hypothetical protein